jgi:hypothetical protein
MCSWANSNPKDNLHDGRTIMNNEWCHKCRDIKKLKSSRLDESDMSQAKIWQLATDSAPAVFGLWP